MKTTTILAWSASLIWSVEGLVAQQRRQSSGPKVVGLETERRHVSDPLARDRMRRRDTVEADLDNEVCSDRNAAAFVGSTNQICLGNTLLHQHDRRHTRPITQVAH